MSKSTLVNYTKLSPNCNKPRTKTIKKITIHHMACNLTVEQCGNLFAKESRQASSNYGIGTDGRVGLYVDEANRAWTSGSADNDQQAITIEVANDQIGGQWHVSDKAYNKLIDLCVDICKRNGIKELKWTGDKNGTLTCHYMFQATACPGPYLKSKMPDIAKAVNAKLNPAPTPVPKSVTTTIKKGDLVSIVAGAKYWGGKDIPDWVNNQKWYVESVGSNGRVVINKNEKCTSAIMSPIDVKYLTLPKATPAPVPTPAPAPAPQSAKIQKGSLVKIAANAKYWNGVNVPTYIKNQKWYVYQIGNNGRVIINKNQSGTQAIMSPIDIKYLTLA